MSTYVASGGAFFDDIRALTIPFALVLAQKGVASLKKSKANQRSLASSKKQRASKKPVSKKPVSKKHKQSKLSKQNGGCGCKMAGGKETKKSKVGRKIKASNKVKATRPRKMRGGDCGCAHIGPDGQLGGNPIMNALSTQIREMSTAI